MTRRDAREAREPAATRSTAVRVRLPSSQDDWTRWGDEHPWLAGVAQLGIYLMCWVAFFACLALVAGLFVLVTEIGP